MSYLNKIGCYQADCKVLLGRVGMFSEYIQEFSKTVEGRGLDLGTGPKGPNGKYFSHCTLDGCDVEMKIVESLGNEYNEVFTYQMGSSHKLPYKNGELDFLICSCVIQHLNSEEELKIALCEIARVLKSGGKFYLMFKAGTHNTLLTHFNSYYSEERTFRVFEGNKISEICETLNLQLDSSENLLDDNWIPYTKMIFIKNF